MRTRRESFFLVLFLGILNALTPFTIDLYLPAFPEIARDLNTSVSRVALSVSIYFVGFALGQILYGPLLDRFGRKKPIYVGLTIYLLASIGCMQSTSIEMLLVCRFISALGGSAASVGATAMVRDYFPPQDGAKVFSMLMLVLSVSPLLAPSVGSFVVVESGWRMLFAILSGMAVVDLALVAWGLPMGYKPDPSVSLSLRPILEKFKMILSNEQFRTHTLAGSFSFAGLFVYIAASPVIYMEEYAVGPKLYGLIFAILAVGMIGGGQLNRLLIGRFGTKRVFSGAIKAQVGLGALFMACALLGVLGLISTTAFLFLILACAGISYPNAAALALAPFTQNVGSASSLLGFIQLGVGALVAAVIGLLNMKGILPTATVIAASSLIALGILFRQSSIARALGANSAA